MKRKAAGWLAAVSLIAAAETASAQTNTTPASHWGSSMYPAAQTGIVMGFEWLAFTEFGKDICPEGSSDCSPGRPVGPDYDGVGLRDRYNFQEETVGLNLFSATYTSNLARHRLSSSNLTYSFTLMGGWQGDTLSEFYQNEVIHGDRLAKIPRDGVACEAEHDFWTCNLFGLGMSLNYNLLSLDHGQDGETAFRKGPLFVGAGAMASTVEVDAHVQLGVQRFTPFPAEWGFTQYFDLYLSSMMRGGILQGGAVFPHVASHYLTFDAAAAVMLTKYQFPVLVELALIGTTGHFLGDRRPVGDQSEPLPQALAERFYRLRVELGTFTFETFNDSVGGKDKGPSYGVRMFLNVLPGTPEGRTYDWLREGIEWITQL